MNHVSLLQEAVLEAIKRNKEGRTDYLKWEFKEGNHIPVTAKLPRKGLEGKYPLRRRLTAGAFCTLEAFSSWPTS